MVIFWSRFALMFGRIWQGEAAVGAHVAAQCSIYKVHNYMYSTCTRLRLINARTFSVPPPATPPGARRGGRGGGASEPTAMIATNQTLPPRSLCTAARAARRKRSEKDAQTGTERGRRQQNGPGRSPQSFWKDEVLVPGQETAELPVVAAPRQKAQHVRWPYMYGEPLILSAIRPRLAGNAFRLCTEPAAAHRPRRHRHECDRRHGWLRLPRHDPHRFLGLRGQVTYIDTRSTFETRPEEVIAGRLGARLLAVQARRTGRSLMLDRQRGCQHHCHRCVYRKSVRAALR